MLWVEHVFSLQGSVFVHRVSVARNDFVSLLMQTSFKAQFQISLPQTLRSISRRLEALNSHL